MVAVSKRSDIAAFLAMDVLREAQDLARAGRHICHMEVGQPGSRAPLAVRERAKKAIDEELLGYTQALGIWPLREQIAAHYKENYDVTIEPAQVVITTGSSAGFILSFLATLDAGDVVAIPRPGYPCYREILKLLDLQSVELPLDFENGFLPTIEAVTEAVEQKGAKALLLASPSNPTGRMISGERLNQICDYTTKKGVWFFSDEIYHGLSYDAEAATVAGAGEQVIVLNSFSKYYSMTGWRIGWMVVPSFLARRMEKLNQHLFISAPSLSQYAAVAAFDALDELEGIKRQYQRNRDILCEGLVAAGFANFAPPDGAFYVYVDVSGVTDDSLAFSQTLLRKHGIAASPGVDFDRVDGQRMMRFSYAGPEADVVEAVRRLAGVRF